MLYNDHSASFKSSAASLLLCKKPVKEHVTCIYGDSKSSDVFSSSSKFL